MYQGFRAVQKTVVAALVVGLIGIPTVALIGGAVVLGLVSLGFRKTAH